MTLSCSISFFFMSVFQGWWFAALQTNPTLSIVFDYNSNPTLLWRFNPQLRGLDLSPLALLTAEYFQALDHANGLHSKTRQQNIWTIWAKRCVLDTKTSPSELKKKCKCIHAQNVTVMRIPDRFNLSMEKFIRFTSGLIRPSMLVHDPAKNRTICHN